VGCGYVVCGCENEKREKGGLKVRRGRGRKGTESVLREKRKELVGQFRMNGLGERRGIGREKELQAGRWFVLYLGQGRRTAFCFLLLFSFGLVWFASIGIAQRGVR
jgi:hypothetical protein